MAKKAGGKSAARSVLMLLGAYSPAAHGGIARYAAEHGWHLHADMARVPRVPGGAAVERAPEAG